MAVKININRKAGFDLNPKDKVVNAILNRLIKNDGYCPCDQGDTPKEDTKCPCKHYMEDNKCCCGLYVKIEQ